MALRVNCQSGDKTIPVAAEVTMARIIAPKNIPTTDPKPPTMETPPNGRLLSRENRRHGKKMVFYFLFMPRIAVGSNALVYARHERELMGCKSPMCESC